MAIQFLFHLSENIYVKGLKAHTHTPIFGGSAIESALESAYSSPESADSNANSSVGM